MNKKMEKLHAKNLIKMLESGENICLNGCPGTNGGCNYCMDFLDNQLPKSRPCPCFELGKKKPSN